MRITKTEEKKSIKDILTDRINIEKDNLKLFKKYNSTLFCKQTEQKLIHLRRGLKILQKRTCNIKGINEWGGKNNLREEPATIKNSGSTSRYCYNKCCLISLADSLGLERSLFIQIFSGWMDKTKGFKEFKKAFKDNAFLFGEMAAIIMLKHYLNCEITIVSLGYYRTWSNCTNQKTVSKIQIYFRHGHYEAIAK